MLKKVRSGSWGNRSFSNMKPSKNTKRLFTEQWSSWHHFFLEEKKTKEFVFFCNNVGCSTLLHSPRGKQFRCKKRGQKVKLTNIVDPFNETSELDFFFFVSKTFAFQVHDDFFWLVLTLRKVLFFVIQWITVSKKKS